MNKSLFMVIFSLLSLSSVCLAAPTTSVSSATSNTTISPIPPTYFFNSTSSLIFGSSSVHSLYANDTNGLDGYIFSFDAGNGTLVNDSYAALVGTASWINITKTTNSTIGAVNRWCVYINNTYDLWNSTSCANPFSYTTIASTPTWDNLYCTATLGTGTNLLTNITCLASWFDKTTLDECKFGVQINGTGAWTNYTATLSTGNISIGNTTFNTYGGNESYRLTCNNTYGFENTTDIVFYYNTTTVFYVPVSSGGGGLSTIQKLQYDVECDSKVDFADRLSCNIIVMNPFDYPVNITYYYHVVDEDYSEKKSVLLKPNGATMINEKIFITTRDTRSFVEQKLFDFDGVDTRNALFYFFDGQETTEKQVAFVVDGLDSANMLWLFVILTMLGTSIVWTIIYIRKKKHNKRRKAETL